MLTTPNQTLETNCRHALEFRCAGFFGRCIRWQRPRPAAVGELIVRRCPDEYVYEHAIGHFN
jgi:hypothetical protein